MTDHIEDGGPSAAQTTAHRPRKLAVTQNIMLTAVLTTIILILVVVITIVLYGLEISKAPRTVVERALSTAEAATRSEPSNPQNWVDLTNAYIAAGRYADARTASAKGKKVSDLPAFYIADAFLLERQGKTDEAIDAYEIAKQRAVDAYDERVRAASEKGATYASANSDLADAAIFKARLLSSTGDGAAALVEYDIALKIDPRMADVLAERAGVKVSLGDTSGARADYEAALRFVPDMTEALEGLEKLGSSQ